MRFRFLRLPSLSYQLVERRHQHTSFRIFSKSGPQSGPPKNDNSRTYGVCPVFNIVLCLIQALPVGNHEMSTPISEPKSASKPSAHANNHKLNAKTNVKTRCAVQSDERVVQPISAFSASLRRLVKLATVECRIEAFFFHEFVVRASFGNAVFGKDENFICVANRGKTMCDYKSRAPLGQFR